jgi:hypothetical protein
MLVDDERLRSMTAEQRALELARACQVSNGEMQTNMGYLNGGNEGLADAVLAMQREIIEAGGQVDYVTAALKSLGVDVSDTIPSAPPITEAHWHHLVFNASRYIMCDSVSGNRGFILHGFSRTSSTDPDCRCACREGQNVPSSSGHFTVPAASLVDKPARNEPERKLKLEDFVSGKGGNYDVADVYSTISKFNEGSKRKGAPRREDASARSVRRRVDTGVDNLVRSIGNPLARAEKLWLK